MPLSQMWGACEARERHPLFGLGEEGLGSFGQGHAPDFGEGKRKPATETTRRQPGKGLGPSACTGGHSGVTVLRAVIKNCTALGLNSGTHSAFWILDKGPMFYGCHTKHWVWTRR